MKMISPCLNGSPLTLVLVLLTTLVALGTTKLVVRVAIWKSSKTLKTLLTIEKLKSLNVIRE